MADWWKKGYFFQETFSIVERSKWTDVFKPGNIGLWIGWYSFITIDVQRLVVGQHAPRHDVRFHLGPQRPDGPRPCQQPITAAPPS